MGVLGDASRSSYMGQVPGERHLVREYGIFYGSKVILQCIAAPDSSKNTREFDGDMKVTHGLLMSGALLDDKCMKSVPVKATHHATRCSTPQ